MNNNDSQSENEMLILPAKKKVITQTDWLEITAERARIQNDDGKIIIDENLMILAVVNFLVKEL